MSFKRFAAKNLQSWVWDSPNEVQLTRRFRRANRLWRKPLAVAWDPSVGLFRISADRDEISVARTTRVRLYKSGIRRREQQLSKEYLLDRIPFAAGDYMIDIGANIGEVSRLLAKRHGVVPLAFEPDRREFRALERNLTGFAGECWNELLWSAETELDFFDANDSGDSSVFAPRDGLGSEKRRAVRLDSLLKSSEYCDVKFRFVKIEAEGAEPEVLEGAVETLERSQFVAVDAGPERGHANESTLIPVYEFLRDKGFSAVDVYSRRLVVLFQRRW